MTPPIPTGVLTISDRCAAGEREDGSGPAVVGSLAADRFTVIRRRIIPDDLETIEAVLREWSSDLHLILTTGGTGFAPRDVTPEATCRVIDRHAPGLAEALRADGLRHTPFSMLSRGVAGIAGRALIINLPGSPRAVREAMKYSIPFWSMGSP